MPVASNAQGDPAPVPTGLLLLRGAVDTVVGWAERGLTPVRVVPLPDDWCAVVPSTLRSAVPPPYDDPVAVLLARPVPHRLRPAVGVTVQHRQALLAVTPARWRAVQRWVAWQAGAGLVRPARLPTIRLADLARVTNVTGTRGPDAARQLRALADVVHDPDGDPVGMLRDVLHALQLPGGDLLGVPLGEGSTYAGAVAVEPSERGAAAFTRMVTDDKAWRDELEGRT